MSIDWEMYDEQYANIDAPEPPSALPDGNYNAVIESLEFGQWPDGSPKLSWRYVITSGDHTGRIHTSGAGLNQYTKGDLDALGFKGHPISYVVKNADAVKGAEVVIRLHTSKKGGQYTYLNKVVSLPVVAESAVVPPAPGAAAPVAAVPAPAVAPSAQAALPGVPVAVDVPF